MDLAVNQAAQLDGIAYVATLVRGETSCISKLIPVSKWAPCPESRFTIPSCENGSKPNAECRSTA